MGRLFCAGLYGDENFPFLSSCLRRYGSPQKRRLLRGQIPQEKSHKKQLLYQAPGAVSSPAGGLVCPLLLSSCRKGQGCIQGDLKFLFGGIGAEGKGFFQLGGSYPGKIEKSSWFEYGEDFLSDSKKLALYVKNVLSLFI